MLQCWFIRLYPLIIRASCSGCSTTIAGLPCAGSPLLPTQQPLGLRSKSNRKCSRNANKVIIMIAISAESLGVNQEVLHLLLLCLATRTFKLFSFFFVLFFFSLPSVMWRRGNRRLGVGINSINRCGALLSSSLLCPLPPGLEAETD